LLLAKARSVEPKASVTFNCALRASREAALVAVDLDCLTRQQVKVIVGELHVEIAEGEIDAARQHRRSYANLVTPACARGLPP
jgi:hypothetical protein